VASLIRKLILILLVAIHNPLYSQINVRFNEFNISYNPRSFNDTLKQKITSGDFSGYNIQIVLKDNRGEVEFIIKDKKSQILCKGNYTNSRDTLQEYLISKLRGIGSSKSVSKIRLEKYFVAIPSGEWIFFKNGIESRRVQYTYEFSN
jgi:hypothetical protein